MTDAEHHHIKTIQSAMLAFDVAVAAACLRLGAHDRDRVPSIHSDRVDRLRASREDVWDT